METQHTTRRRKGLFFPTMLILVGTLLLLERSGLIDRHLIWQWLPLLPVSIGAMMLYRRTRAD